MKILLITHLFAPSEGGVQTLYEEICKRLNPKDIVVLTSNKTYDHKSIAEGYKEFDKKQKYKIYRIPNFDAPYSNKKNILNDISDLLIRAYALWKTYLICKKEKIDLVVSGHITMSGFAAIIKKVKRIPYFTYVHGIEDLISPKIGKLNKNLNLFGLKNSGRIVCVNNLDKTILKKEGLNGIEVIYNAVDIPHFKTNNVKLKKKYGFQNKKIILSVSRLQKRKNQEGVINAMPEILKKISNAIYLVVGRGSEEENLRKLVTDKKLGDTVIFAGFAKDKELIEYYNMCDLFIMPNIEPSKGDIEAFSINFLEAMACGKPVIGGKSGGVPEVIQDGVQGYLVDGDNTDEIAEKTIKILKNKNLYNKMCKNARKRAEFFSYDKLMEKFKRVCNEVYERK